MLSRVKNGLFPDSEAERILNAAKINKTHDLIPLRSFPPILALLGDSKSKNNLLNNLYKRINSSDPTIRIKALVVFHACLRHSFDEEFCDVIMDMEVQEAKEAKEIGSKKMQQLTTFIQERAVNFYIVYLKKICANKQSYNFIREYSAVKIAQTEMEQNWKKVPKLQIITHGFKILNMMNFILQSQEMFNKMGRYNSGHNQILNMYMQLLQDLDYFNIYIKRSINAIIFQGPSSKKKKNSRNLDCIHLMLHEEELRSETEPSLQEIEETKHNFLYISESQKTSDRLYEYYHNRYYYKTLRSMITFPTFLVLEAKQYNKIKSKAKRVDRNLVTLVRKSKYEYGSEYEKMKTEPNLNSTYCYSAMTMTELGEPPKFSANKTVDLVPQFRHCIQQMNLDERDSQYQT